MAATPAAPDARAGNRLMNFEARAVRGSGAADGAGGRCAALTALVQTVQTNCHIADARHAADLPLCIYLLQMREFYRWECDLPFGAALPREAVGPWIARREALWAELEARAFEPVIVGDRHFDPMHAHAVNAELAPLGLVYGAGLASAGQPAFFLAHLEPVQRRDDGLVLHLCGREHARGLFAPPAALLGGHTIVLRREALARWLWEKFEAFSLRRTEGPAKESTGRSRDSLTPRATKGPLPGPQRGGLALASPGGAIKALADAWGLHDTQAFVAALPRLVDELCETLLLHELGEHRAGQWLEPGWAAIRLTLGLALEKRRTELYVRAVRDHIADLEVTLPTLLERDATTALHFWFANYEGVRAQMFPALAQGYADWRGGDAGRALLRAAQAGATHFRALAAQVLSLHERFGRSSGPAIERLLTAPEAVCVLRN
jgi:hypothetical protein